MDLNDTRQIPMWMASPALPVVVGVLLFVALGVVTAASRAQAPEPDETPTTAPKDLLGPTKTPTVAPPTPANTPALVAARKVRELSRRGQFLEALEVLRALDPSERHAMGNGEFEGQETRLLQGAGERLLIQIKALEPKPAIERLQTFLDVPGVEGRAIEAKILVVLGELSERAD